MAFGVDAGGLATAPGTYQVRATLDTQKRGAMWQGRSSSEPMAIRLVARPSDGSPTAAADRDYQAGRYALLDRQFDRARSIAERLLARTPGSIAGYELAGDAFAGLDRLGEAAQAYEEGIKAFNREVAARPFQSRVQDDDYPTYLVERLGEVRRRQGAAR